MSNSVGLCTLTLKSYRALLSIVLTLNVVLLVFMSMSIVSWDGNLSYLNMVFAGTGTRAAYAVVNTITVAMLTVLLVSKPGNNYEIDNSEFVGE